VDHWFKNVFVLPGIVTALALDPDQATRGLGARIVLGLLATCLVAASNYVLNEILDAPFDRHHPTKWRRPVPAGRVSVPVAWAQWVALMVAGLGLASAVSGALTLTLATLWLMGCIYNLPPVRSKELPYVDVLSEAVNNPLRMLAGWFMVGTDSLPPGSLLMSYWMIGAYFMGMKRFAEFRDISDPVRASAYRRSFAFYTEPRLLVSIMFYGSAAMLFFGAFIMRYRLELILAFPLVALNMAIYLHLAFKPDSAVQRPEGLWREPLLMASVLACVLIMAILLFVDLPVVDQIFTPTAPIRRGAAGP
jgi:4-hydroxybenzoate polyprenyltransferase